jgi:hypothetical protein
MNGGLTFNEARHGLLEILAEDLETTLFKVVREYNHNEEFRRRIVGGLVPVLRNLAVHSLIAPHGRDEFEHM